MARNSRERTASIAELLILLRQYEKLCTKLAERNAEWSRDFAVIVGELENMKMMVRSQRWEIQDTFTSVMLKQKDKEISELTGLIKELKHKVDTQ